MVYKNGNIHSASKTMKIGNYYLESNNNRVSKKNYNKIDYSGALLYFNEPKNISFVFSESDLIVKMIKSIGPHSYQITNPTNGQKNEYYYKNGVLQKAVIHHTLLTFNLIKENIN